MYSLVGPVCLYWATHRGSRHSCARGGGKSLESHAAHKGLLTILATPVLWGQSPFSQIGVNHSEQQEIDSCKSSKLSDGHLSVEKEES